MKQRVIWPRNSTVTYIPERIENMHPYKTLYTNVHCSIIYYCQEMETTSDEMDKKMWSIHAVKYHLATSSNKVLISATMWIDLENIS